MTRISDEIITAWLDGEASPEQTNAIETAIATSPELGLHVARLSRVDRLLAPAFAETLNAPIPDRFEALLARSPKRAAPGGLKAFLSILMAPPPLAAAAASLVVGVVLGGALLTGMPTGPGFETDAQGRMIANNAMAAGLASAVSGEEAAPVSIRLSMVDDGGQYCRQFQTMGSAGLACLEGDAWIIDTLSQSGRAPGVDGTYAMAAGAEDPAIAAALQRRGVRKALDRNEESLAIALGWKLPRD